MAMRPIILIETSYLIFEGAFLVGILIAED